MNNKELNEFYVMVKNTKRCDSNWAIKAVNSSRTQLIKRVSVVSDDGVASTSSGESSDQEQIQDVCKDWLEIKIHILKRR